MFRKLLLALMLAALAVPEARAQPQEETVVLLHGLIRSHRSMAKMERALQQAGYRTCNIGYPSRRHTVGVLAREHILPEIESCAPEGPVHFVTHSLGGILVRVLAEEGQLPRMGRVVMLGPPNQGSEVVDAVGSWWLFGKLNGPAGGELGTGPDSVPNTLGPATFEVGVIAGTRSINWINSSLIDGRDDGKVSVERARLEGMQDFIEVPSTHTFMMRSGRVIRQALHFLEAGQFDRGES
ncbi:MAG: hypothetical protein JJ896_03205 [Rhodothermales bacterium]|nr:hypothetical protein [Rhodothermales bacterium]MBO6778641.1 hypothetical protein [Rhodothermales bacterium]